MTRLNAYLGRSTDALSAFLLLLAVMLAGGYAPSAAQGTGVPPPSPTDAGTGSHRSAPFISKQQQLASEARDDTASSGQDGKSKAFLPPKGFDFAALTADLGPALQILAVAPAIAASPFDARAPPAKS